MNEEVSLKPVDPAQIESSVAPSETLACDLSASPEATSSPAWHQVLIGPSGLRPGFGLLLFIVLIVALSAGVGSLVHLFHHPSHTQQQKGGAVAESSPQSMLITEGVSFMVVALATWIMGRVERRKVGVYGFGGDRKLKPFLAGLFWGAVFLSVLVGSLWKAGLLVFDGQLLHGLPVLRYGAIWAVGFLLVGLFEEYLLRGYLQYTLSRGLASLYNMLFETSHGETLGFWTAALLLSFVFGFGHVSNPGESSIGLVSAGIIGVIFCLTLWRTGSLWWALGFHASWDWAQSFLFGVADSGTMVKGHLMATHPVGRVLLSGGATGPEGSALVLPVMAAVVLVVVWTLPARPGHFGASEGVLLDTAESHG